MSDSIERLNTALSDRYRVHRPLGEGGMATVYLADDLRHDRKVAIKVLKPELSAVIGAERFLAEIKTTANLQHPHILPLFDSGTADGLLFYVMPYVDGESLRDRIDRQKQLPVDDALAIAGAVAGALDYAHRRGVLHRDIKPANILLHDGQPVVADFGIALALSAAGGGRMTETGLSLGTPHYMSPEQAAADRELTAHSDVYALACVTYEMLTGAPPFSGPSAQAVLMQILTEDARRASSLRKTVPAHVDAALAKALEKLPADRFATADAFATALKDPAIMAGSAPRMAGTAVAGSQGARGWRGAVWPLVTVAALALAVLGWLRSDEPAPMPVTHLVLPTSIDPGDPDRLPRTMRISPDGRRVVFQLEDESGNMGVYVRDLDSPDFRRILANQVTWMEFSPDSEQILLNDGASLRLLGTDGRAEVVLVAGVIPFSTTAWSDDGWIYFVTGDEGLERVRPDGSGRGAVPLPDGIPALSPMESLDAAGGLLVRHATEQSVGFLNLKTGQYTAYGSGISVWLVEDRHVVWYDDGRLYGQRIDPGTGAVEGPAVDLLGDTQVTEMLSIPLLTVSRSGTLLFIPAEAQTDPTNLVGVGRDGRETPYPVSAGTDLGFTLSPQGDRIAFEERPGNVGDIYVAELSTGLKTRLTFDADAVYPTWTPDGTRLAYYRVVGDEADLFWRNADGSGTEEVLLAAPGSQIEVRFFPDGRRMIVRQGNRSVQDDTDLWVYEVGDGESGRPLTQGGGNEVAPRLSPDGRFVAYVTDELGATQHVFVRSVDNPEERWQITDPRGGNEPLWSPAGDELFYRRGGTLLSVPVALAPTFRRRGAAVELFNIPGMRANTNHTAYDISPDGETFYFVETPKGTQTHIILNWVEELRSRLGG